MRGLRKLTALVISSGLALGVLAACGSSDVATKGAKVQTAASPESMRYFMVDGFEPTRLTADGGGTEAGSRDVAVTSLRGESGVRARVTVLGQTAITDGASPTSPKVSVGQDQGSSAVVYGDFGGGVQAAVTISDDPSGKAARTGEALMTNLVPVNPDRIEDGLTASGNSGYRQIATEPPASSTTASSGGTELVTLGDTEVKLGFRAITGSADLDMVAAPNVGPIEHLGNRDVVVLDNGGAQGTGAYLVFVEGGYKVTLSGPTTADDLRELVGSVKAVDPAAWDAAATKAFTTATAGKPSFSMTDDQSGAVSVWLGEKSATGVACRDGSTSLASRCSYLASGSPVVARIPGPEGSLVLACNLGAADDVTSASVNSSPVALQQSGQCGSGFISQVESDQVVTVSLGRPATPEFPDPQYTTAFPAEVDK